MRNNTRQAFNAYTQKLAELNGVDSVEQKFAVEPSVDQKLEDTIQQSAGFLKRINSYSVDQQKGAKIGLEVGSTIASTTDTRINDRQTADPTDLKDDGYFCQQTNFDTHITYNRLDSWSKYPDFQQRLRNAVTKQIARCLLYTSPSPRDRG